MLAIELRKCYFFTGSLYLSVILWMAVYGLILPHLPFVYKLFSTDAKNISLFAVYIHLNMLLHVINTYYFLRLEKV